MSLLAYAITAGLATVWAMGLMVAHLRRLAATGRVALRMRETLPPRVADSIALVIPIKGSFRVEHLELALTALEGPVDELIVAIEDAGDEAHRLASDFLAANPDTRLQVILTGACPSGANGKVHNLLHGIEAAQASLLLFADADVALTPAMVRHAAALLATPDVGAVFAPPYYGPADGLAAALMAAYTNTQFTPSMARADESRSLSYCAGAFYGLRREIYDRIGGFAPFLQVVSDDAYLGRAVTEQGLAIRLVPATALMPAEPLPLSAAIDHLRRWVLLGRIFAPSHFRKSFFSSLGFTALIGTACSWPLIGPSAAVIPLTSWAFLCVIYRAQDQCFVGTSLGWRNHAAALLLDLLLPLLWIDAALTRRMVWRGREYRLGKGGEIMGYEDRDGSRG